MNQTAIRAFISTDTSREHYLYSIGAQYMPNGGRSVLADEAAAELSRILADVEPVLPHTSDVVGAALCGSIYGHLPIILAESLAWVTADGGPLDELAWDSATSAACQAEPADGIESSIFGMWLRDATVYSEARQ